MTLGGGPLHPITLDEPVPESRPGDDPDRRFAGGLRRRGLGGVDGLLEKDGDGHRSYSARHGCDQAGYV